MRILYIECAMGAAGDMLMAALASLLPDKDAFVERMNGLGIPGMHVHMEPATKCGIVGNRATVHVHGEEEESHDVGSPEHAHDHGHEHAHPHEHHSPEHHSHAGMHDIAHLIGSLPVSDFVKKSALDVYRLIADAEAHAHGKPVEQIHFHEVGMMDAVADIVGVCMLMEQLKPDRVVVSPIHVGSGQVRCAHGILPVPAPATAYILRGVPTYGGEIRGELCTPTGAALLRHFADAFGPQPVMAAENIGYGMGRKDFEAANCVRALLGESSAEKGPNDLIVELACNLDDMTGEALGHAVKQLMKAGALDVCIIPIQMKKGRPGHMLCCLCREEDADALAGKMLSETTTLGVRRTQHARYALSRSSYVVETGFGKVRVKQAEGYGIVKRKAEFDDLKRAAKRHGVTPEAVRAAVDQAK